MATQVLRVICVSAAEPRTDTGSGAVLPDRVLMPVESVTSVHRHTQYTWDVFETPNTIEN